MIGEPVVAEETLDVALSGSAVDKVIDDIVRSVRDGRLVPGQRLVEADFVKDLSVSRSVVREAFQRLNADGLLQTERHRGVRVRLLSAKELHDVFALRVSLEGLAARLATPALVADPFALKACHQHLVNAVSRGDVRGFIAFNHEFHSLIAEAADNGFLSDALRRLGNTVHQVEFRMAVDADLMSAAVDEHSALLEAILSGDGQNAQAAAERHQTSAFDHLRSVPLR